MRHIFDLPAPVNRERHEGAWGPTPNCKRSTGWIMDTVTILTLTRWTFHPAPPNPCGFRDTRTPSPGMLRFVTQRCRGNADLCRLASAVPWALLSPCQHDTRAPWGSSGHRWRSGPLEKWLYIKKGWRSGKRTDTCSERSQKNLIPIVPCVKLKCRSLIHQNLRM